MVNKMTGMLRKLPEAAIDAVTIRMHRTIETFNDPSNPFNPQRLCIHVRTICPPSMGKIGSKLNNPQNRLIYINMPIPNRTRKEVSTFAASSKVSIPQTIPKRINPAPGPANEIAIFILGLM